jgi:phosphoribosylaminoimidazolecarboxamide formyltransferase / IMP cyclohydrolase
MKIKTALLSVHDKTGLVELAAFLAKNGVRMISTGGTARLLRESGYQVTDVSEYTGFPEMMDGRVKTLHPKIHGGLLHLRDNPEHVDQARFHGIEPIDLVVVNLYPFEQTISNPEHTFAQAVENIDIGGPSMLRSAAKNYRSVVTLIDPHDYPIIIQLLEKQDDVPENIRLQLAAKVFRNTAYYDSIIGRYFTMLGTPDDPVIRGTVIIGGRRAQNLRYGENPHQRAALYGPFPSSFQQLHGKELSYNNILDLSAAVALICEFTDQPAVAILKHNNPCGAAVADSLLEAWHRAFATDKQAPFGGIIAVNKTLDLPVAEAISEIFSEVIIAPAFTPEALAHLKQKKNLRLIENHYAPGGSRYEYRSVLGGLLVQESDNQPDEPSSWHVVTKREPNAIEWPALRFAWKVVKHVKSNAIVFAKRGTTLGIGAGQMSRIDACRLAIWKAESAGLPLGGGVLASDAFFPFPDTLEAAADAGASAVIQPGGSVRDKEVVAAADAAGLAMVFTGCRHFKH